jgi:hypothetical protein
MTTPVPSKKTFGFWLKLIGSIFSSPVDSGIALTIILFYASVLAAVMPAATAQIALGGILPVSLGAKSVNGLEQKVLGDSTTAGQIGVYYWGGQINGISPGQNLTEGLKLSKNLNVKTIRITLAANSDITYYNGDCISNFSLAQLAARDDFKSILADPQFTTVIITAYDGVSFSDCYTKNYLDPAFFTETNTAKIQKEYTDLANYLKQFNKTFIVSNWEADNDIYCVYAYYATPGSCSGINDKMTAYTEWMQARIAGIKAADAKNVKSALEFCNIHSLENQGMPSVLNNIVPAINPDYFSYSSYESINISAEQTANDIDVIRGKLTADGKDPNSLFIGEAGFDALGWNQDGAKNQLSAIINVFLQKNIPYIIVWNLIDNPGFGVYNATGTLTGYGRAITDLTQGVNYNFSPAIAGVQGYDSRNGTYTDNTGYDNEYLILYGAFQPSGNTVYLNGTPFTPIYESSSQINVQLDNSVLAGQNGGSNIAVTVAGGPGNTTPEAYFKLLPENAIAAASGFSAGAAGYSANAVYDNQFLMLTGNFSPKNNTVYINNIPFTPLVQNLFMIIVQMDQSKLKGTATGKPVSVYVTNGKEPTQSVNVTVFSPPTAAK